MDLRSTPFPGKAKPLNRKTTRNDSSKNAATKPPPPISRQKRVFGTARTNTNMPTKNSTVNKPLTLTKPSNPVPQKLPKPSNLNVAKKTSVCFQKQVQQENPRTPVTSTSLNKTMMIGTPYYTAENCSKCRFDKLETTSYWLDQIKMAESVGKHFVSAAFFGLALESKAEPIKNLCVELKRYLGRHKYLSEETEWRDVIQIYKLLKEEKNAQGKVSVTREASANRSYKNIASQIDQESRPKTSKATIF